MKNNTEKKQCSKSIKDIKSDNYMGSNREKSNISFAILGKSTILCAARIISPFGCSNIIFADSMVKLSCIIIINIIVEEYIEW